ncbi:MAG: hypothetical protein ABJR05_13665 [Balneola sp.]
MNKNKISSIVFALSLIFFIASTSIDNKEDDPAANCFHCGSVTACEVGGQAFGWTGCWYNPQYQPPHNCNVFGSSECGGTTPGEGD